MESHQGFEEKRKGPDEKRNELEKFMERLNREVAGDVPTSRPQIRASTVRSSMNIMDGEIQQNNDYYEKRMRELTDRKKMELVDKTKKFEDDIADLKKQLKEKEDLLSHTEGQLRQSRSANQTTLEDFMKIRKKYTSRIHELEVCIAESQNRLAEIQQENERKNSEGEKVEELQKMLKESIENLEFANVEVKNYESEAKENQELIGKLEAEKVELQKEMNKFKEENEATQKKLAEYIDKFQNRVETESSAHQLLKEQLSKVQKEYDEMKNKLAEEKTKYADLEAGLAKKHRDSNLMKIDLRISNRTKLDIENQLEEKNKQCTELEEKIVSLEAQDTTLATQVKEYETTIQSLKSEIEAKDQEYSVLQSLRNVLTEQKDQLEMDIDLLKNQLEVMKGKLEDHEGLKKMVAYKNEQLDEKASQLEMKTRQCQAHKENVEKLKEAMNQLNSQLDEFEDFIRQKTAELEESKRINEILDGENKEIREKLRAVRIELNEAKSLKAFTEKRLELTEDTLRTQSQSKESEVHSILEKLSVASIRNEELSQELSALTTQASALEAEKYELRKSLESANSEKDRLNKDLGCVINTVVEIKDENLTLQESLREATSKAESWKYKWETVHERLTELEETIKIKELTFNTKIDQQQKLIEHLCQQLEAHDKKKKKTQSIFTPKRNDKDKEMFTPSKSATTPYNRFRGLLPQNKVHPICLEEKMVVEHLEKKKADLRSKLTNLHAQNVGSPRTTQKNPTLPTPKKEENVLLKERSNTIQVSHGAVTGQTHRYKESRCDNIKKCMGCWEPIYKARPVSTCERCDYVFHLACAVTAGDTCGLSEKKAYEIEKVESSKRAEPINNGVDDDVRGFVKVRSSKMQVAEKRFLVIEDNKLKVYVTEADRKSARPFAIYPLNDKTTVFFRIDKTENQATIKDEIAYAMKVSFFNEEGKTAYLYMFHKNKRQKRYWTQAILKYTKMGGASSSVENTLSPDSSFSADENKENQLVEVKEQVLVSQPRNKLYVNRAYYLPSLQTYLLGCDEGLYSVKDESAKPVKIEGPTSIYEINVLEAAKLGIFIEGSQRTLTTVYSGLLKSCAEAAECSNPKFTTHVVPHTKDCYMFASRSETFEDTTVAAACSNGLLLCTMVRGELTVIKQFLMKDNITSMLMTPQTVFFGSNDVYELDTKTFEVEEFLDSTDDAIYYVQIINESHGSYPVAILNVSQSRGPESKEPEYLICFQDIGIFVDTFGRRSRAGDVLWSHVPVAFEYRHPYLYIVHFSSVEVQKLDAKSYTKVCTSPRGRDKTENRAESQVIIPEIKFFPVNSKSSPSYIGEGARGVVIALHEAHAVKVMELSSS